MTSQRESAWFFAKVAAAVLACGWITFHGQKAAREAVSGHDGTVFDDRGPRSLPPGEYAREMGVTAALLLTCAGAGFWCTSIAVRGRRSSAR